MQSRAIELLVGLFVCLGIAAIFILTMRVSDVSSIGGSPGYALKADFYNIGGLNTGAPVRMAGIRIGRVANIHLDPQTYEAVVVMHIQQDYKLPKGSSAAILTSGLLGNQYVGITPGGALDYMQDGDRFDITQGAIILEKLISQFMYNFASGGNDDSSKGKSDSDGKAGAADADALFAPQ